MRNKNLIHRVTNIFLLNSEDKFWVIYFNLFLIIIVFFNFSLLDKFNILKLN